MTKCRSVIVDSQGSSPDFGPAKAAGRSQTRPVEGIGPRESHVALRQVYALLTWNQRK